MEPSSSSDPMINKFRRELDLRDLDIISHKLKMAQAKVGSTKVLILFEIGSIPNIISLSLVQELHLSRKSSPNKIVVANRSSPSVYGMVEQLPVFVYAFQHGIELSCG